MRLWTEAVALGWNECAYHSTYWTLPTQPSKFSQNVLSFWNPSLTPSRKAQYLSSGFTFAPTFYPLIFVVNEAAPVVFLLFVCGISMCLNELSMIDGKSVVGISIHSHGECWATGIGFGFGVGAGNGFGYGILEVAVMSDAGPSLLTL